MNSRGHARVGITRFAGSQQLNSTFFSPGPQKSYQRKNSSPDLQNTDLRPHLTSPASGRRQCSPSELRSAAASTISVFEQWRIGKGKIETFNDGGLDGGLEGVKSRGDSDLDRERGVTLASSLAVFMQGPGNLELPLRPIVPKSNTATKHQGSKKLEPEQRGSKQQEPGREELEQQKIRIVEKTLQKPRSSMASQMAALLQTPGGLSFAPRRPRIVAPPAPPAPLVNFPTPVYCASLVEPNREGDEGEEEEGRREEKEEEEVGGENEKTEKEGAYELKTKVGPTYVETQSIFGESSDTLKPLAPGTEKHEDLDTTQYWRTPDTTFIYRRPMSPTQITVEEQSKSERRGFRHWRDGDIIGDEASELPKSNKGRQMMEKMGYKEGMALGINGDSGLIEPMKVEVRFGNRGLGLAKQRPRFEDISRVDSSQMVSTQIIPTRTNGVDWSNYPQQTSNGITQQLQQMNITTLQQAVGYSLTTPLGAYQTRLRMVQILGYLDTPELLDIVDYNYILAVGMSKVAENQQQSPFGFLAEADLMQIVTIEYRKAVLRKD